MSDAMGQFANKEHSKKDVHPKVGVRLESIGRRLATMCLCRCMYKCIYMNTRTHMYVRMCMYVYIVYEGGAYVCMCMYMYIAHERTVDPMARGARLEGCPVQMARRVRVLRERCPRSIGQPSPHMLEEDKAVVGATGALAPQSSLTRAARPRVAPSRVPAHTQVAPSRGRRSRAMPNVPCTEPMEPSGELRAVRAAKCTLVSCAELHTAQLSQCRPRTTVPNYSQRNKLPTV